MKFSPTFLGTFSDHTRVDIKGTITMDNGRPLCWWENGFYDLGQTITGCGTQPGTILNIWNLLCLAVKGGVAYNGATLQMEICDRSPGQQWWFGEGTYRIQSKLDESFCLDIGDGDAGVAPGSSIILWECNGWDRQAVQFDYEKQQEIFWENKGCMDVLGENLYVGGEVILWECSGEGRPTSLLSSQRWMVNMDFGDINSTRSIAV